MERNDKLVEGQRRQHQRKGMLHDGRAKRRDGGNDKVIKLYFDRLVLVQLVLNQRCLVHRPQSDVSDSLGSSMMYTVNKYATVVT